MGAHSRGERAAPRSASRHTKNPLRHKNTRRRSGTELRVRVRPMQPRISDEFSAFSLASSVAVIESNTVLFDLKLSRLRPSIYHMAFDSSPETRRPVRFEKRRADHITFENLFMKTIYYAITSIVTYSCCNYQRSFEQKKKQSVSKRNEGK